MKKLIIFLMIIGLQSFCFAQSDEKCPAPTKNQFAGVCSDLYFRHESGSAVGSGFTYSYQEKLWELSCAEPGKDSIYSARIKIQKMWNKHREEFRCYNYANSAATDATIAKFSLDNGFSGFIVEAVRKYQLDMNFIDPKDNKTPLDFIFDQEKLIRNTSPVNTEKADEYKRVYKILRSNGAKHSWEINQ